MDKMPERIWLEDGNDEYPSFYFDDSVDCTEYVRADLVAEKGEGRSRMSAEQLWVAIDAYLGGFATSAARVSFSRPDDRYKQGRTRAAQQIHVGLAELVKPLLSEAEHEEEA